MEEKRLCWLDKASGFCGLSVRAVVHSFKQQDGFAVHGLGEEVNSHSSHWTERGSSHTVRNRSAETSRQIRFHCSSLGIFYFQKKVDLKQFTMFCLHNLLSKYN